MSIAIAIFGLALLIVLHEGGHFLVARLCGMKVERFSIGFGSPLISFKRGGTIYQIAPIPLGGFVQITGLNPHEEFDRSDPYVYPNRPRWMRLAVLVAGPGANYLTAVVFALVVFIGFGKMTGSTNVVEEVLPNSPAQVAGLKSGDVLMTVNGKELNAAYPIRTAVLAAKGSPVTISLRRAGKIETVTVTPKLNPDRGEYLIGIQPGALRERVPIGEAFKEAILVPVVTSGDILRGLYEMIAGKQKASLQGPVGIARHMAQAADRGFLDFIHLMTMLSVYLGLFNLLPLPALDGGRALFLGIGALRSKEVNAKTEAAVHMVGLVLLLGVFVIVTFKDIKEIVVRFVN